MHMFFCLKNFDDEYITKNFTKDKDKNKALIFNSYTEAQDQLTVLRVMNEDYYRDIFISTF